MQGTPRAGSYHFRQYVIKLELSILRLHTFLYYSEINI